MTGKARTGELSCPCVPVTDLVELEIGRHGEIQLLHEGKCSWFFKQIIIQTGFVSLLSDQFHHYIVCTRQDYQKDYQIETREIITCTVLVIETEHLFL